MNTNAPAGFLNANVSVAHVWLGQVYEQTGAYEDAIAEFHIGISLSGGSTYAPARLARAFAIVGKSGEAKR